jgi:hypothetical protein
MLTRIGTTPSSGSSCPPISGCCSCGTGQTFEEAWPGREAGKFGELTDDVLGRGAFIRNKRATGRARDLGDIEGL